MCIYQDGPKSCSALQKPGEQVEEFDVVLEVDTESLTEEAYRVGTFSGTVTLLVEAQVLPASQLSSTLTALQRCYLANCENCKLS